MRVAAVCSWSPSSPIGGTRYTSRGKVIRTEQSIHGGQAEAAEDLGDMPLDQWDGAEL